MRAPKLLVCLPLLATLTACGKSTPDPITVKGVLVVSDYSASPLPEDGKFCTTTGGFADVGAGAQVRVKNADGKQVGIGEVGEGVGDENGACRLSFEASEVPYDDTYTLTIGGRDDYAFTAKQAGDLRLTLES